MQFVLRFVVSAVALWAATVIVPGIGVAAHSTGGAIGTLLVVTVIFSLVNALVKPVVQVLGCALYVLTLGLFALVVNALMFLLAGWLADELRLPFHIDGFWAAFWGAIVVALVSWLLGLALPNRLRTRG